MLRQSEFFRPKPGYIVYCKETNARLGVVIEAPGNICYYRTDDGEDTCYIWRFTKWHRPYGPDCLVLDCLNSIHYTWPPTNEDTYD